MIVLFHKYMLLLTSLGRNTSSGVSSSLTREGVAVVDTLNLLAVWALSISMHCNAANLKYSRAYKEGNLEKCGTN